MPDRTAVNEYFARRDSLEKRWDRWRPRMRVRGLPISAKIEWINMKDFAIAFSDGSGGVQMVVVKKQLHHLTERPVAALAKKLAGTLRIGPCRRCETPAILRSDGSPDLARLCAPCFSDMVKRADRAEQKTRRTLQKKALADYKAKGFKYLLRVWIHPRSGGDDTSIEVPFTRRPTKKDAAEIAKRKRSAILGDFTILDIA